MSIGPIAQSLPAPLPSPGAAATPRASGVPFSEVVSSLLDDASRQQQNVSLDVQRLVTGESDNIHDVVLSVAQADLAFRFVMEIRDQLISAYHEIMRMQV